MSEHTPTPWDYVPSTEHHGPYITSDVGGTIADLYTMSFPSEPSTASGGRSKPVPFYHEMADPNAAFIVKAVNSHDDLIAALEFIRDGYANQDVNHVDYRVKVYQVALDALAKVGVA